ncbi:MAG: hypothetical protein LBP36_02490 [Oscillospiraceae bacterium]|jgi:hypothetical protein|nr:hypothetical protein [Oscillospiraceae bacterium]
MKSKLTLRTACFLLGVLVLRSQSAPKVLAVGSVVSEIVTTTTTYEKVPLSTFRKFITILCALSVPSIILIGSESPQMKTSTTVTRTVVSVDEDFPMPMPIPNSVFKVLILLQDAYIHFLRASINRGEKRVSNKQLMLENLDEIKGIIYSHSFRRACQTMETKSWKYVNEILSRIGGTPYDFNDTYHNLRARAESELL